MVKQYEPHRQIGENVISHAFSPSVCYLWTLQYVIRFWSYISEVSYL